MNTHQPAARLGPSFPCKLWALLPSTGPTVCDVPYLCAVLGCPARGPGALYLPFSVGLIAFFNYFYTFLQLDPDDLSDQLKRQGASIPSVRPGRATATFITKVRPTVTLGPKHHPARVVTHLSRPH